MYFHKFLSSFDCFARKKCIARKEKEKNAFFKKITEKMTLFFFFLDLKSFFNEKEKNIFVDSLKKRIG